MPTDKQLLDRVNALFEHKLGLPPPPPDDDLFKSGVMDSLAFVNMLLQIEAEFGVKFTLENIDLERFRTLGRIAEYLGGCLAESDRRGHHTERGERRAGR